ncbi:GTPase-activating protein and VPS9 domain-containing protein 1 [Mytilus coruscus]|uniref:GTPase-activating protein and VPS9 domain-containing protein 1 n=1 Tax=Mytilus coruscus TaxID=42192 RepID=A0A6J8C409_MYTCO|nr:GTPase-activating protein and VPS9 domain-containing protein 1 [Mytilus coruscus]
MTLPSDLVELAHHLKQESLFVHAQRTNIHKTFEDVRKYSDDLFHQSWIARQQRSCMYKLLFASNISAKEVCSNNNQLEWTNFVDGYKYLGYQDSKYGEFLKILRDSPVYTAHCIDSGEKSAVENTQDVLKTIVSAIYGNVILHEDEHLAMQMMKTLAELQLANAEDPRRLIRKGTCGFRLMFLQLFDCLFSARLFLTAALHEAVMKLMMEDEWFYDIDPGKALVRFPAAERQKRFGAEGTPQYAEKLQDYRKFIVDKLVILTNRFVSALKNNMHCFPPALGWLISQVYHILLKTGKHDIDKIRVICVDLVFTLFVCPAICDPEPYGITSDIHISHIARHNLMQIAQIIQVLAVSQWEEDSKEKDLYDRFEKGCVSSLLDSILETCGTELPNYNHGNRLQVLSRSSTLITVTQLNYLVIFFRNMVQNGEDDSPERKQIEEAMNGLPPSLNNSSQTNQSGTPVGTPPGTPSGQRKGEKKKEKETVKAKKNKDESSTTQVEEVIVISLWNDVECPGMLSEQKVLSWEQENKRRKVTYHEGISNYVASAEPGEKRTRFSLSQDQESIGNTSDLQEAISEGASSHSVGSVDLENDDDPDDNFSDMISANVSGRGTPNISGRDTPPSPAGSVEAPADQLQQETIQPIQLPVTVPKTNREDVTERFGKFEIKNEFPVDETKSTVSDTWSTDVLASDSEPPEQNQYDRLEEIGEEIVRQSLLARNEPLSELSETASDAWSTDVLASDNEDKQAEELSEFDQDDIGSVMTDVSSVSGEHGNIEIQEDTPLASGQETPENQLEKFDTAANGATSVINKQNKSSNEANLPSAEASVSFADFPNYFHDNDSYRHGPSDSKLGNTTSFTSRFLKKKRPKTVQMNVNNEFDGDDKTNDSGNSNKLSLPSTSKHTRFQQKPKNSPGNLSFAVPETSVRNVQSENFGSSNGDLVKTSISQGARPKVQQRATYPLFDNQSGSGEVQPVERRGKISNLEANSVDSGIGTPRSDSGIDGNSRSEVGSLSEQTGNLKISEQQNTKFDANRLSLALSMFDPVSNENAEEDQTLISLDDSETNNTDIMRSVLNKRSSSNKDKRETVIIDDTMFPIPSKSDNSVDLLAAHDFNDDSSSAGSGNSGDDVPFAKSSRSASFDNISQKSEEKGTVDAADQEDAGRTPTKSRSLFKSFKEKVIRSGKKNKDKIGRNESFDSLASSSLPANDTPQKPESSKEETSDDILEKYRPKPASNISNSAEASQVEAPQPTKRPSIKEETSSQPYYDPNNLENCVLFLDAKRKIRLVLNNCDCDIGQNVLDFGFSYVPSSPKEVDTRRDNNELLLLLRSQLAEAINLQNKESIAQLHEAIRCIKMFDSKECKKLVNALKDEYQTRTAYISYLIRCQQGLLATQSYVQRLLSRVQRDKTVCNKHLVNVCVRLFIETKEGYVVNFIQDFQKLTVSDEKTDLVERFLQFLYQQMTNNPIWQASTENQMDDARLSIERYIMSRIYTHAMFPNGDGDILRDQILHQHIKKLAQIITPNHKHLQIPKMYQFECPWTAAQREIYMINAYKTPKDKLKCVHRCSTTIMNLLSMANDKSVPAADEFMPVLIFVIIKANPPCLLSTVQYVNSFYGNRLQGEEQYWWMQFSSVVEYIKTMDYSD